MDIGIRDRVALVCGASRGFGRAIATSLAREGAKLVICARTPGPLHDTAEALRSLGAEVLAVPADLAQAEDLNRLVDAVREAHDRLEIMITNTAHPKMGNFEALDEADWRAGFEELFLPTLRLLELSLPIMRAQGWGRVVNISTSAVRTPSSTYLLSGVFRTALASLSKSLANEYGPHGVLINTVCPGLYRTPLGESLLASAAERRGVSLAEAEADYAKDTALRRIGEPEQLGDFVASLCGRPGGHITGQLLTVDGGKTPSLF